MLSPGRPFLVSLALAVVTSGCGSSRRLCSFRIPAAHETIFLAPLVDRAGLDSLYGGTGDSSLAPSLSGRSLNALHRRLGEEFDRCGKFGLYDFVDDPKGATILVTVELLPGTVTRDSLHLPVRMQASHIPRDTVYVRQFSAKAALPSGAESASALHRASELPARLVREFPCKEIVEPFYAVSGR